MPRVYKYELLFREEQRKREAAENALSEIRLLHAPIHDPNGWQTCSECKQDYQCRTIEIVEKVLSKNREGVADLGPPGGERRRL